MPQKSDKQTKKREFMAKPRNAMKEWYELTEQDHGTNDYLTLIEKDPNFFDSYLSAAQDFREMDDEARARELEDEAFKRAKKMVEDKESNWPDEMPWAWLENRHIIRALMIGTNNLWKDGRNDEALDVYRKLLHSNLNDNIGARYAIIGLRLGLSYEDYMNEVWPGATMPAEHIMKWWDKHAKKFPEEFKERKKYMKDEIGLDENEMPV